MFLEFDIVKTEMNKIQYSTLISLVMVEMKQSSY